MTQWVRALAIKPDDPSSNPRINNVKREPITGTCPLILVAHLPELVYAIHTN